MTPERTAYLRQIAGNTAAHGKIATGPLGEVLAQAADAIRELAAEADEHEALRIEHEAWGVIIDATRAARDEARAEVAAYKVRVDGIEAERVIAVDAFHRIRRNRDDVAALANEARAEADALRARVAELERAADAARKAERADALAYATHIGDVYRGKHGGGGDYCRALGEFLGGVQAGAHEGAAGGS